MLYDLLWSRDGLHYGFWEDETRTHKEAVLNPIRYAAEILEVDARDLVLDAGCGAGGTSIYFAKHRGARVRGVSLSTRQLHLAQRRSETAGTTALVRFSKQDYSKTSFRDASFTKILGLESVCHAESKAAFLQEANRLLAPKGTLAIIDAFLAKRQLPPKLRNSYRRFLAGWALPPLESREDFHELLVATGFRNVSFDDKTYAVRRSSGKIYRLGLVAYAATLLLSLSGLIHKAVHGHAVACIHQKQLLDHQAVVYGIFTATR